MKAYPWAVAVLTSLALGLVACPKVNPPEQPVQKASLEVTVQGVGQAGVQLSLEGSAVFDDVVSGSMTFSLDAGAYVLDGKPVTGYQDPSPVTITLAAGASAKAQLVYQKLEPASAPVAKLEIVSVKDLKGVALPGKSEVNANKTVPMFASQTEEPVCVTLKATDASGAAVKNASLVVSTSEVFGEHITIIRGCPTQQNAIRPMSFRDGIITDANGLGVFTLYATFGGSTSNPIDMLLLMNQPAKIVVAAENADGSAILSEMKGFFYNISHLYFGKTATTQRTGTVFPEETNLFKPLGNRIDRGDPKANEFLIGAALFTKQPQQTIKLPNPLFTFKFEMTAGSDKVGFVPGSYDSSPGPNVVLDNDGSVRIEPLETLGVRDLPVSATVKVTLITRATYGNTTYEFPLKDFTITKRWIGSYLGITKSVDHHVLSWAGPQHHLHYGVTPPDATDHTLAAKNDPAVTPGSVFTATFTLKLRNEGKDAVYNVSLADAIPAELGVLESTFSPAGATYDATSHVVTWNWQNTPDPKFDKLDPGQEIVGSFQVYLRQKPGFAWDQSDLAASRYYQVQPISSGAYSDPYKLVNGLETNDVTGTWYTGAEMGKGGYQMLVDFNGAAFEKDVVIYGVRPTFSIEKKLVSPGEKMDVGQIAYFDISIKNTDRSPRYDALKGMFPDEFSGKTRDNPYGRNVRVTDVFDTGLDFVSATPLAVTDDEGLTVPSSYNVVTVPDKGAAWEIVPLLGGGDSGKAQIALRGNLPSPGLVAPTSSLAPCMPNPYWHNCAFLDADNLNQPADVKGADWTQVEARPHAPAPLHANWLPDLRYGIRACAKIEVVLRGEPWIELTSIGENDVADPNVAKNLIGVHQTQDYYYFMSVLNHGGATAQNLTFNVTMTGDRAVFSADTMEHAAYVSNNGGLSWSFAFNATTATTSSVSFPAYNLAPNALVLYSVSTTANLVGDTKATGTATYTNPVMQTPFLPAVVVEDTQIQP